MNRFSRLCILALALCSFCLQQTHAYVITETAGGLTTDIPDATISGTVDNWTVQLGTGWIFLSATPTIAPLTEPENSAQINFLAFADATLIAPLYSATKLTWQSEAPGDPFSFSAPTPVDSVQIGVFHGTLTLDSVATPVTLTDQADPQNVPESPCTLSLLAFSVLGIVGAARFCVRS